MLKPLYARQRRRLMVIAGSISCGAALLVPLAATSDVPLQSDVPLVAKPARDTVALAALRYPAVVVRRDPFDGVAAAQALSGTVIVRAVMLGDVPKALVESGGGPTIVGIGASLAQSTVTSIAQDGIRLADGRVFRLAAAQP
jgi:hypothetical protein